MVCIYCGSPTSVANSRLQRRSNSIWRRRVCDSCQAIFTTEEHPALSSSLRYATASGKLRPFSRDQLFVSLLESCRHRPSAVQDASSLTTLIVSRLFKQLEQPGLISRDSLIQTAHQALTDFDSTAAGVYAALHPHQATS